MELTDEKNTYLFALLLSILLAIPNYNANAQGSEDCDDGYIYGGKLLVDHILCADVYIEYCFKFDDSFGNLVEFKVKDILFVVTDEPCDLDEVRDIFNDGYWDLYGAYVKQMVLNALGRVNKSPALCHNGFLVVSLETASCSSKDLVYLYTLNTVNPDGSVTPKAFYGNKKCSEQSFCESQYQICWKNNPDTGELESHSNFVGRNLDVNDECPDSIIHRPEPGYSIEIECIVRCGAE